jgi:membrane peptidoglycan carboxypeptidase
VRHIHLYTLVDRRQRRKKAAGQSARRRLARAGLGCAGFALLALVAGILLASLAYAGLVSNLPSLGLLPELLDPQAGLLMQPTRLYDRSGEILLYSLENDGIPRRYLYLDSKHPDHFSPELVRAVVGSLDPNFWGSPGFRLWDVTNPQPATIAERLASDLLLWQEPPGLRRALRMRLLAAQLIARYGHVQVLEWYLNSAAFGHLAFGADSAAHLYLGKPATGINLAEAAVLAAAIQAPALNPLDAPAAAAERRRAVLDGLRTREIIAEEEYQRAVELEVQIAAQAGPPSGPALAFSRLALQQLARQFGQERLERGGLRVITSLDYQLQLELACLVQTQLQRLTGEQGSLAPGPRLPDGTACLSARLLPTLPPRDDTLPATLQASAAVLDPRTGHVLALLGDTTLEGEAGSFSPRAPGSLLTPFVALAGFSRGMAPATLLWDIPPVSDGDLPGFANPDGAYHGPVRLRLAMANDYLAPQARLLEQFGAASVWRLASALGLSGLEDGSGAGVLFRGGAVSPLELAQAYGVFAGQGTRVGQRSTPSSDLAPAVVLYVDALDGAAWLDARQPVSQAVVSPQLSYLVHHVLSDATARWPSLGYPNPLEIGRPSAAKIGQAEAGLQAWTAGYTPQRAAVFWLGLPQDSPGRVDPRAAAGMWHALVQHASRDLPAEDWPEPAGIVHQEVCDPSGQLPTAACPEIVSEVFASGSEPVLSDTLFRKYQINRETGRLATVFTPAELVEEQVFLVAPEPARAWAQAAGFPLPPDAYDAIQPPGPDAEVRFTSPVPFAFVRGQVELLGTASGAGFRFYQVLVGQGLNPQTWLQVGPDGDAPVTDGLLGAWDTRGQEGLFAVRLLVARADQQVDMTTIQVTVDNTPPRVRIPYPLAGQQFVYAENRAITFQADAGDALGMERVVWLVDGAEVGRSVQPPYVLTWPAEPGSHTLQVEAYDRAGNLGQSEVVDFSVE